MDNDNFDDSESITMLQGGSKLENPDGISHDKTSVPDETFLRQRNRRSSSWHPPTAFIEPDVVSPIHNDDTAAISTGLSSYFRRSNGSLIRSFSVEIPSELREVASRVAEQAEELVIQGIQICKQGWDLVSHHHLPNWLKDNEYLIFNHRPELNSFKACFESIFRIHTETVNIWTHLLGFIAFLLIAVHYVSRPSIEVKWEEKAVFSAFFLGAILCLGFSWLFHTVYCHSERVGKLFNKLDYCGIALLTMGSFVPWLYYSFYCDLTPKIIYVTMIMIMGTGCIIVSLMDRFSTPEYRSLRAGVFIGLGLSGVFPTLHYILQQGLYSAIHECALGWLLLMAFLYIVGALIYAFRFPECLFPGMFDIWFQSHQIFHVFVVAAAFVHFYGISVVANYRLNSAPCPSS